MNDDDTPQLRRALYDNLSDGRVEIVGTTDSGEERWRLTGSGIERAEAIIDRYIDGYGELAADALAAAMDVPGHVTADVVAARLKTRAAACPPPEEEK